MTDLTITLPDDWHLHLRDGAMLESVLHDTARRFGRAIVMPNLKPPIVNVEQANNYYDRIKSALPPGSDFEPLMTLFLTDVTTIAEVEKAALNSRVHAFKYYPAGATTNSENGVTDFTKVYPVLEAMQKHGIPLLLHGEVTELGIDIFDREAVFIERHLMPITQRFPGLKIVLEHITTREAADFVLQAPPTIAATITVHHLMLNRNALFVGGIQPHHYCLPVLKREVHRQALIAAATSANRKFFLGTDSAPHERRTKETSCGCAGIYSSHAAIELYAEVFENVGAIDKLEGFASFFGADFYGLPRNKGSLTLTREPWNAPSEISYSDGTYVPFFACQKIKWSLKSK